MSRDKETAERKKKLRWLMQQEIDRWDNFDIQAFDKYLDEYASSTTSEKEITELIKLVKEGEISTLLEKLEALRDLPKSREGEEIKTVNKNEDKTRICATLGCNSHPEKGNKRCKAHQLYWDDKPNS